MHSCVIYDRLERDNKCMSRRWPPITDGGDLLFGSTDAFLRYRNYARLLTSYIG